MQNPKSTLAFKNQFRELILPNEILAFTSYSNVLFSQYPSSNKENIIELPSFPNLSSEGGSLLLVNIKNGLSIDGIICEYNIPGQDGLDFYNQVIKNASTHPEQTTIILRFEPQVGAPVLYSAVSWHQ